MEAFLVRLANSVRGGMVTGLVLLSIVAFGTADTLTFLDAVPAIIDAALSEVSPEVASKAPLLVNTTSFAVLGSESSDQVVDASEVGDAVGRAFGDVKPGTSVECMLRIPSNTGRACSTREGGLYVALNGLLKGPLGYEVTLTIKWTRDDPRVGKRVLGRIIRFLLRYEDGQWKTTDRIVMAGAIY